MQRGTQNGSSRAAAAASPHAVLCRAVLTRARPYTFDATGGVLKFQLHRLIAHGHDATDGGDCGACIEQTCTDLAVVLPVGVPSRGGG